MLEIAHPVDWFKAFLGNKISKTCKHGTGLWATWTTIKGLISNIGHQGHSYGGFEHFSPCEIMDFIGLIMLNSLCPSMRFEHKFNTQEEDPVAGNDFCAIIFGEKSKRR